MAKSSKPSNEATAGKPAVASPADAAASGVTSALPSKPAAKKSSTAARKRTTPASKTAAAKTKKAPARKKAKPAEFTISDDDIRLRAYFIAQHRALSGLSGDSAGDWLEARRQLFEEATQSA